MERLPQCEVGKEGFLYLGFREKGTRVKSKYIWIKGVIGKIR